MTSHKKCEKNVTSRFSRHFVESSIKLRKMRFLIFLHDVPQKVLHKMREISVL